eukprot:3650365-Amphidinium_carterae.2
MWWCTKHEATEKAIAHAAHGLHFWKGRGTLPPELIKETAGAAVSSAAAAFEDEGSHVAMVTSRMRLLVFIQEDFCDDVPDQPPTAAAKAAPKPDAALTETQRVLSFTLVCGMKNQRLGNLAYIQKCGRHATPQKIDIDAMPPCPQK